MIDRIIKGNGKNNTIKFDLTGISSWAQFVAANNAGTLRADVLANNDGTGTTVLGTPLNRATTVDTDVINALGLTEGTGTIKDALIKLRKICQNTAATSTTNAYAKTSSVTLQAELTEVHDPLNCINNNAITIPSGITKIRGHIKGTVTQATFSHGKFSVRKNGTEVYHADGKTLNPIAQYQVDENFYLDVAAGDVLTIFCVSEYSDPDKASTTLNSIDIDFIA